MSVCGIKPETSIDKAARAVCAILDGTSGPLDAGTVEDAVYHVVQIRSAFGAPTVDQSAVLMRVAQWLKLDLWDWDNDAV